MVDRELFVYLTHKAGYRLQDAAKAMGLKPNALSMRLSGKTPFKLNEMEAWMDLVGCDNAGPVVFPRLCRLCRGNLPADSPGPVVPQA